MYAVLLSGPALLSMPPPRYWSPEFVEAFVEALNDDAAFQKAAGDFSETVVFRCLDTPGGQDVEATYVFEGGEVVDAELWIEDAPSEDLRNAPFDKRAAMARATASYDLWCKLDRGEIGVLQALASPDYQIEGPTVRIMANLGVLNGMNAVAAHVDKTY